MSRRVALAIEPAGICGTIEEPYWIEKTDSLAIRTKCGIPQREGQGEHPMVALLYGPQYREAGQSWIWVCDELREIVDLIAGALHWQGLDGHHIQGFGRQTPALSLPSSPQLHFYNSLGKAMLQLMPKWEESIAVIYGGKHISI